MPINTDTHSSVSVNMPKDLHEALKQLAKVNHRSVSAEICYLVERAATELKNKSE